MANGDIETVKAAIAAALGSTAFTDALAAVDAEKNDGTTTPGPAAIYPYERAVSEAYPEAEVIGLTTTYAPDDDVKHATFRIAVIWTQTGDNEATVTTTVERLVRATRDVLFRSVLGGQIGLAPMLLESESYSQLAPSPAKGAFMKGGSLILAATTFAA